MTGSRWTIGERLGAGFLLVIAVMAVLVVLISLQLSANDRSSLAAEAAVARTQRVDELERAVLLFSVSTRDALLERSPQVIQQFAASEARLDQAVRALHRAEVDSSGAARVQALVGLVSQFVTAGSRAVAEGRSAQLDALVTLRVSVLASVQQMLQEQVGSVEAALNGMEEKRHAAAATIKGGAAITCLLLVLIGVMTVRSIRAPARELVAVASALRAGEWQPALALRSRAGAGPVARFEMTQIADAFGAAAAALESREQRLMTHAEIARAAGASLDLSKIAHASLIAVVQHLKAEVGVLYCQDSSVDKLIPVVAHAAGPTLAPVSYGEGIVGQCARDRKPLVVRDIPRDSAFAVKLGYDEAPPRVAAAVPILFNDEAIGVLLVASLRELDADVLGFLSSAAAQIGVGLANARAYREVQELLAKVRAQGEEIQGQNEELQAQGEEIQGQNEELQAQGEEMQTQNEQLQAQSEEIQAQNEDLRRQAGHLREQTAALRDVDERKNQFLGVLAHELRNPLAPISNSLELLKRNAADPASFERAQQVLSRQVRHLTRLVEDLLDVTRISGGKVFLKRQRLNVIALIKECLADQRVAFEQHGMVLALELPEVPIHVEGDHTRLCQVFSNVLANALKFCQPGARITLTVTLDAPAREVAIHMADDGIGIDAEFLATIFEPFTQAESELARTKGGLGLGLPLAKGLVELHGGRMEARSQGMGRGAEFVVTLPIAEAQDHPAEPPTELQAPRRGGADVSRVLVIDDNADAANSLAELVSLEGCQVEVAHTARSGLDAAQRFRPEVVLCDIGLPGMDGYEFAREARRDPLLRSSLLIALTGYGSPSDQVRSSEAGFDLHLTKPPDVAVLMEALHKPRPDREAG